MFNDYPFTHNVNLAAQSRLTPELKRFRFNDRTKIRMSNFSQSIRDCNIRIPIKLLRNEIQSSFTSLIVS